MADLSTRCMRNKRVEKVFIEGRRTSLKLKGRSAMQRLLRLGYVYFQLARSTQLDMQVRYRQEQNTKLSITHSFLELQSPDFAWKFIWKVQINYKSTKKVHKYKSTHNSVIFRATDSRFCMEIHMDSPNKFQKQNGRQKNKMAAKSQN